MAKKDGRVVRLADGPQPAGAMAVVPLMTVAARVTEEGTRIDVNIEWGKAETLLGSSMVFGLRLQQMVAQMVAQHYDAKLKEAAEAKPKIEVPQVVLPKDLH